jgi:DNA modification methylase
MNKIEFGDCRDTMRRWASEGVKAQMCVTSPPYFGLRDYGHEGQIGLEQTPEEYIAAMVEVFRCVKDVLADDGTLWLNIGDSYASGGRKTRDPGQSKLHPAFTGEANATTSFRPDDGEGVKPKDLIGIPWMLAFALRADGWYLRQDIIWHKPNPMPESVRDRCTKAHEYIFLLSKSERYYYDAEAIAQPLAETSKARLAQPNLANQRGSDRVPGKTNGSMKAVGPRFGGNKYGDDDREESRTKSGNEWRGESGKANRRSVWTVATRPYKGAHFATFPPALIEPCILAGSMPAGAYEPDDLILSPTGDGEREADPSMEVGRAGWSRPRRDAEGVRPMSRAEQAAYAEQLRNSQHKEAMMQESGGESTFAHYMRTDRNGARAIPPAMFDRWVDLGWLNQVSIPPALAAPHRSIVLDPFMGSGTTAAVSLQHGRKYLGCELNPEYGPLQNERIDAERNLFCTP